MSGGRTMDDLKEIAEQLAGMDDPGTVEKFLNEILTRSELNDLALRWALMKQLAAGHSQREIAAELGISLCKITRGAKILKDESSVSRSILVNMAIE